MRWQPSLDGGRCSSRPGLAASVGIEELLVAEDQLRDGEAADIAGLRAEIKETRKEMGVGSTPRAGHMS
jgi:hypothetical protein